MNEEKKAVEESFYLRCAELLECAEHTYRPFPWRKRTRWNNRAPGNGRYPGYGLIRMFGTNCIHVNLHRPVQVNRVFTSAEDVYAFLEALQTSAGSISSESPKS